MENNNDIVIKKVKMSPADKIRIWKKENVPKRSAQMQRRRMRFKVTQEFNNILLPDDYPFYT